MRAYNLAAHALAALALALPATALPVHGSTDALSLTGNIDARDFPGSSSGGPDAIFARDLVDEDTYEEYAELSARGNMEVVKPLVKIGTMAANAFKKWADKHYPPPKAGQIKARTDILYSVLQKDRAIVPAPGVAPAKAHVYTPLTKVPAAAPALVNTPKNQETHASPKSKKPSGKKVGRQDF